MNIKNTRKIIIVLISLLLCITSFITSCTNLSEKEDIQEDNSVSQNNTIDDIKENILTPIAQMGKPPLSEIVSRVSPAVVGLKVNYTNEAGDMGGSLGSGVIVHNEGYIITNNHVAGGGGDIDVVFQDGSVLDGNVLWTDANLDLAVVKVEGQGFTSITMGSSENIQVGDAVIAIGTPLAMKFQHTVTAGIISAKHRTLSIPSNDSVAFMEDLLQTDASINPGNSGGPLISMDGKVIGINTLKVAEAEGMGFAIPIDICIPIVKHIINNNNYKTPYLGIMVMDKEIAKYLGETLDNGVRVMAIDKASPAYACGIREGSIILEMNNEIIDSVLDLRRQIYEIGAGENVMITYQKDGTNFQVECSLKERTD